MRVTSYVRYTTMRGHRKVRADEQLAPQPPLATLLLSQMDQRLAGSRTQARSYTLGRCRIRWSNAGTDGRELPITRVVSVVSCRVGRVRTRVRTRVAPCHTSNEAARRQRVQRQVAGVDAARTYDRGTPHEDEPLRE